MHSKGTPPSPPLIIPTFVIMHDTAPVALHQIEPLLPRIEVNTPDGSGTIQCTLGALCAVDVTVTPGSVPIMSACARLSPIGRGVRCHACLCLGSLPPCIGPPTTPPPERQQGPAKPEGGGVCSLLLPTLLTPPVRPSLACGRQVPFDIELLDGAQAGDFTLVSGSLGLFGWSMPEDPLTSPVPSSLSLQFDISLTSVKLPDLTLTLCVARGMACSRAPHAALATLLPSSPTGASTHWVGQHAGSCFPSPSPILQVSCAV